MLKNVRGTQIVLALWNGPSNLTGGVGGSMTMLNCAILSAVRIKLFGLLNLIHVKLAYNEL